MFRSVWLALAGRRASSCDRVQDSLHVRSLGSLVSGPLGPTGGVAVRRPDDDIERPSPVSWTRAITSARAAGRLPPEDGSDGAVVGQVLGIGPVDSTQDEAAALVVAGLRTGTLLVNERQLRGRGRQGRDWEDDPRPGASLAATLVLDAATIALPFVLPLVPHALGLAVHETIVSLVPADLVVALKWPNDVVQVAPDGSLAKLAGILVERRMLGGRDVLLCGVGVNVDHRQQPRRPDRIGIADLCESQVDLQVVLVTLVAALDRALAVLGDDPAQLLDRYRSVCCSIGRPVEITVAGRPPLLAQAVDVDAEGRLVVEDDGRRMSIVSGVVRHLGPSLGRQ
jgi:BirA family transcriptional regulator, biotin operon repressor / biotin---[acetyl-CoA-carboxylase] ligase